VFVLTVVSHWPPYAKKKWEGGSGTLGGLITGHELARGDSVVGGEHESGEVFGDGFSGEVEVPEHFVRAPAAQKLDHVCVDIRDEQRHGASRSEGAGRDFVGEES